MAKEAAEPAPKKTDGPDEWEVRNHMDTITKAHEIMSDPEKMVHVKKLAGRHKKAIEGLLSLDAPKTPKAKKFTSIAQLREHRNTLAKAK